MEEFRKQLFNLQRYMILQTKYNSQTRGLITDSEAFAWSVGLYPLHSANRIARDLNLILLYQKKWLNNGIEGEF